MTTKIRCTLVIAYIALTLLLLPTSILAQRRKVIVDQDARGPATTDTQSILMFLQSPDVEVLGITLVSGDQWIAEETMHALRAVEVAGRTDVPVVPGAAYPLVHNKQEDELWQLLYGAFRRPYEQRLAAPDVIPEPPEGRPTTKPLDEHAVNFIIRMVHKYPHEVTLWAGGPLTNYALAIRMDPELPSLAKELVLMGAGFNTSVGNVHDFNGRREFNWWWDPEAVRIVMAGAWKKITITPHDISAKSTIEDSNARQRLNERVKGAIAKADTPVARYLTRFSGGYGGAMWDEISAAAYFDSSIITEQKELYVNIDIGHGASYGQTIFVEKELRHGSTELRKMLPMWRLATVQFNLDLDKFYQMYIDLMTRPAPGKQP